ncbi:MAG: family 20 glycosylhydrolase [Victivallales bacterium]|nr:family 20 glycosylhydrolase [Victivallales bacterium]
MKNVIIPSPKEIISEDGLCNVNELTCLKVSGLPPESVDILRSEFTVHEIIADAGGTGNFSAVFTKSAEENLPPSPQVISDNEEGYVLNITCNAVQICGSSAQGLWYGIQTLQQLMDTDSSRMQACTIKDQPILKIRGVHWDMKGYQPKLEVLKEELRILSRYKVNMVLLELEDKFRYQSVPEVAVENAYTAEELKTVSEYAKALFITVIPKVQCLAHVDYLLKHKAYAHLRENNHPYQYCARNKEAFKLWTKMVDEIMEIFPDSPYFHVGADESTHLAECDECKKYSRAENFIYCVGKSIAYIKEKGMIPVIWDDIIRNKHGNIDEEDIEKTWILAKDAVIMYWAYGYGGMNNVFPYMSKYLNKNMKVWGASGFSGCGPSWIQNVPPAAERMININAWTKSSIEHGLEGFFNTGWGRIASADPGAEPHETCWLPIVFGAEAGWSGVVVETKKFAKKFLNQFYGVYFPDSLIDFILNPVAGNLNSEEINAIKPLRNCTRFELLREISTLSSHCGYREKVLANRAMYHEFLGKSMVDYRHKMICEDLHKFKESLQTTETNCIRCLHQFYFKEGIEAFACSRFGYDKQLIKEMENLLQETTLV